MSPEAKSPSDLKQQDPRDAILAILFGMLLFPFTGMLRALAFQLLWSWFLVQYGEGPTLQSWFGISVLYSLSAGFGREPVEEKPDVPPKSLVRGMLEKTLFSLLTLGALLVSAAVARVVWGWR